MYSILVFGNEHIHYLYMYSVKSVYKDIAKLSQSSGSSGAELALFPADPTTNPPTPTHPGKFFSAPAKYVCIVKHSRHP